MKHVRKINRPVVDNYKPMSKMDEWEFPNQNAMEGYEHDPYEDYAEKVELEKDLFYLDTDDEDDMNNVSWNAPTRYQLFVAKCEKFIPYCMPDAKVLKIAKAQHKRTGERYVVVDIRVTDVGAFSTPVSLAHIRNHQKNMDTIVQSIIRYFIAAVEKKKQLMASNAAKAILEAAQMEGPQDNQSIIDRAVALLTNKISKK